MTSPLKGQLRKCTEMVPMRSNISDGSPLLWLEEDDIFFVIDDHEIVGPFWTEVWTGNFCDIFVRGEKFIISSSNINRWSIKLSP